MLCVKPLLLCLVLLAPAPQPVARTVVDWQALWHRIQAEFAEYIALSHLPSLSDLDRWPQSYEWLDSQIDFADCIIVSATRQLEFDHRDQRMTLLLWETRRRREIYFHLRDAKNKQYPQRTRRIDLGTFRDMMGMNWHSGYLPPVVPVELCRMEE
jgi:hypothetical protein